MTTVLVDTHAVHWWSAEPDRLSAHAANVISDATELAVASISWFELAWLATRERIEVNVPVSTWLDGLAEHVRTIPITPAIAGTAVTLPSSFPGDPADRLIYATAIHHGYQLVTKDRKLRNHRGPRSVTVW